MRALHVLPLPVPTRRAADVWFHGQDLGCCCLCLSGVEPAGGGGGAALHGVSPQADVARAEGAILATTEMAPSPRLFLLQLFSPQPSIQEKT